MKKSDVERLKKIVHIWENLNSEIISRNITKEKLLVEQFLQ